MCGKFALSHCWNSSPLRRREGLPVSSFCGWDPWDALQWSLRWRLSPNRGQLPKGVFAEFPKPEFTTISLRTLPAIFIWNPDASSCVNGSGLCPSWGPEPFSSLPVLEKSVPGVNSLFQAHEPTAFIPTTLGSSNLLIPLVFKTQRSPGLMQRILFCPKTPPTTKKTHPKINKTIYSYYC